LKISKLSVFLAILSEERPNLFERTPGGGRDRFKIRFELTSSPPQMGAPPLPRMKIGEDSYSKRKASIKSKRPLKSSSRKTEMEDEPPSKDEI